MLYSFSFSLFLTFRIGISIKIDFTYFSLFYIKNFEIFILKIYLQALIYLSFHLILFFFTSFLISSIKNIEKEVFLIKNFHSFFIIYIILFFHLKIYTSKFFYNSFNFCKLLFVFFNLIILYNFYKILYSTSLLFIKIFT